MKLPWVGWYTASGHAMLMTWYGATREVIVTNVLGRPWHPVSDVPDGSEVLEIPAGTLFDDRLRLAADHQGLIVIVFDHFPIQPRTV